MREAHDRDLCVCSHLKRGRGSEANEDLAWRSGDILRIPLGLCIAESEVVGVNVRCGLSPCDCCTPRCLVVQRGLRKREEWSSLKSIQLNSESSNRPTTVPPSSCLPPQARRPLKKIHTCILFSSKQFCTQPVSIAPQGRTRTVAGINSLHNAGPLLLLPTSRELRFSRAQWQNPSDQKQSEASGLKSVKVEFMLPPMPLGSSGYMQKLKPSLVHRSLPGTKF